MLRTSTQLEKARSNSIETNEPLSQHRNKGSRYYPPALLDPPKARPSAQEVSNVLADVEILSANVHKQSASKIDLG